MLSMADDLVSALQPQHPSLEDVIDLLPQDEAIALCRLIEHYFSPPEKGKKLSAEDFAQAMGSMPESDRKRLDEIDQHFSEIAASLELDQNGKK